MFKVGDLVTPDWGALAKSNVPKTDDIWRMGVKKVAQTDGTAMDFVGDTPVGWLTKYWKLAVTPETTFKLIKKHAK